MDIKTQEERLYHMSELQRINKGLPSSPKLNEEKEEKIKTITFEEFSKLELPKDRWLIKDILPKEGFVIIASPSGEKKTWIALSMAGSIANGSDFLENKDFPTIKGRVLYIDEEMSDTELQRRIKLLNLDETIEMIDLSRRNNINFGDEEGEQINELLDIVEKRNIKAIFVDTFRAVAGGLKEDKAEDVREYLDRFKPLKNKGVVIVFLDHCRKPSHFEGAIPKKEQLLGSQDKLASIEALHMIKSEESGDILFYTRKSRTGKEFPPFRIEMKEEWNDQGETIKIELIYKGKLEEKETTIDNAKKAILTLLSTNGMKRKEIISSIQQEHKLGTRNIAEAIRILEVEKKLSFSRVGRENFYELAENKSNQEDNSLDESTSEAMFDDF